MYANPNRNNNKAAQNSDSGGRPSPLPTPPESTPPVVPSQISQASTRSLVFHASQQDRNKYIMVADIGSAKIFSNIIQCINTEKKKKEQMWGICEILEEGIKFYIQDRTYQGVAVMKSGIFQNYSFNAPKDTKYQFEINIPVLIDCLALYGANLSQGTVVKLCYPGVDNTLSILLGEERVVTDCNVKIRNCEVEPLDFKFKDFELISKAIIKSEVMMDALSEIDWLSKSIEIGLAVDESDPQENEDSSLSSIQKGKVFFRSADNVTGSLEVIIPSTNEGVQVFECHRASSAHYKLSHIQQCIKALNHSEKVCIRMNSEGTISLQFVIRATEPVTYVEYLLLPVDMEMEDDDGTSFN